MTISQREARRLRKRVEQLELTINNQRDRYAQQWVGGVSIASVKWEPSDRVPVAIRTARMLRHAVVAIANVDGRVSFYALPLPETEA